MSGFFSGLKNKFMATIGVADAITGAFQKMLASELGKAGLENLLEQFDRAGLGHKAHSGVGEGPPQPLSTEEIQRVLTRDQAQFIASCTGLPIALLWPLIAKRLPHIIERLARPDGVGPEALTAPAVPRSRPPGRLNQRTRIGVHQFGPDWRRCLT